MSKRRKGHEAHEEHENHERWLITYADMITLLMVLFIVMFAIGQTDLKKFEKLKAGLSDAFGAKSIALDGGTGLLAGGPGTPPPPAAVDREAAAEAALRQKEEHQRALAAEARKLEQAKQEIVAQLEAHGLAGSAHFRIETRGLVVTIVTDRVLFDPGSADLRPAGREVLDGMAGALARLPNQVAIEGHTDNRPISSGRFPSNWELSTARATSVLRYLIDHHHLPAPRLAAAGYADQRAVAPNDTDAHRAENRRVEVVVLNAVTTQEGH